MVIISYQIKCNECGDILTCDVDRVERYGSKLRDLAIDTVAKLEGWKVIKAGEEHLCPVCKDLDKKYRSKEKTL